MSTTLRDVAKAAQVSLSTVSLVLNGKGDISNETRERVMRAAVNLNYGAKDTIKTSKAQRSKTLRFLKIAKHGHTVNRDHNTFISDYIDGMSLEADRRGYKLEVISIEATPIDQVVATLVNNPPRGAIVLGTELSVSDVKLFEEIALPVVFIDTFFDMLECNFINMNNMDAVYKILSHLADNAYRDIGFISSNVETINFKLRSDAFLSCMNALKLPLKPNKIVTVDSTYDGAYQDMLALLHKGMKLPECFVCVNDIVAYGCIKAFREFNIKLPDDLSIVGFDNLPMSSTMEPSLTTIDVSKRQIGYLAIGAIDDLIRATGPQPVVKILVGANLVIRESVVMKGAEIEQFFEKTVAV
jgi:LacI family transcriptional regulator